MYRGLRHNDPGAFALALKAQTVQAPAEASFVGESGFLRAAIDSVLRNGFSASFAATLGRRRGRPGGVAHSPLVEARRQRTVGPAPTTAEKFPNDAAPRLPALKLLAPADWQQVGTRPEFYVSTTGRDARGEILLFGRDDYFGRGLTAPPSSRGCASRSPSESNVLVGMPDAPLPEETTSSS